MKGRFLAWFATAGQWRRRGLAAAVAALVYLAGHLAVIGPLQQREASLRTEARRLEQRAAEQRRRLAGHEAVPESVLSRQTTLHARLAAVSDSFPAGLESGLLAQLSRLAEEAGAEAPIFNVRGGSASPAPLREFRLLTVEGEFRGGTRVVTRFLERLQQVRLPLVVDSMALARAVPSNLAHFRFRVLEPVPGSRGSGP